MTWQRVVGRGLWVGLLAVGCGEANQDFGSGTGGAAGGAAGSGVGGGSGGVAGNGGSGGAAGSGGVVLPAPASSFEWLNPKPHGNIFRSVAASADDNVWVGGRGAVLSWNGQKWKTHNPGQPDELYHALWVKNASDTWVGGTRLEFPVGTSAPTESAMLYHYDGVHFTLEPGLENRTIRALAGTSETGYLVLDGGEIRKFDGNTFVSDKAASGAEIWALWPVSSSEAWAVGSAGTVLHRTSDGWAEVSSPAFSDQLHFIGVWAASSSDVWAIYEENPLNGKNQFDFPEQVGNVGFVHYDGSSWSVHTTAPASCSKSVAGLTPWHDSSPYAIHYSSVRGEVRSRRGSLIHGRSSADITASLGNGYCTWHYDGSSWKVLPLRYTYWLNSNSEDVPFLDTPLGGLPTVWATSTQTLLAGAGGQLLALDSSLEFPIPTGTNPSGTSFVSPATTDVFPADRGGLDTIALFGNGAYSAQNKRAVAWTAGGWTPLVGPPGSLDPSSLGRVLRVATDPDGQLWGVGGPMPGWSKWFATRWDGSAWTEVAVEPPDPSYSLEGFPELWQAPGGHMWVYGDHRLRRHDDQGFQLIEDHDEWFIHNVDGTADDDVWLATVVDWSNGKHSVFHDDGSGFQEAYVFPETNLASAHVAATGKNQVIAFATEYDINSPSIRKNASRRFDGSSWQAFDAPLDIGQVWVRAPNDIYALSLAGKVFSGSGAEGDRRLYHYNGQDWRVVFAADSIRRIAGNEHSVWLVGEYGSTVRGKVPETVR